MSSFFFWYNFKQKTIRTVREIPVYPFLRVTNYLHFGPFKKSFPHFSIYTFFPGTIEIKTVLLLSLSNSSLYKNKIIFLYNPQFNYQTKYFNNDIILLLKSESIFKFFQLSPITYIGYFIGISPSVFLDNC